MNKIKIGILSTTFLNWAGGVDFLRLISYALNDHKKYQIFIIVPQSNTFYKSIKKKIKSYVVLLVNLFIKTNKKSSYESSAKSNSFIEYLNEMRENCAEIIYYNGSLPNLKKKVIEKGIQLILPSFQSLGSRFPVLWVGYIADFQHKYYPDFFSKDEIEGRNRDFNKILSTTNYIIVNSNAVREDLNRFSNFKAKKIITLPFSPIATKNHLDLLMEPGMKAVDKDKYFLISNQFWKHKGHLTAFQALKIIIQKGYNVKLFCTGNTSDYRFPRYFQELQRYIDNNSIKDHAVFLGTLPKTEQIKLMINSLALIQPTLFEGGPGGGAVYNAISLGVPVILSDIKINREITNYEVTFFESESSEDLAEKMIMTIKKGRHIKSYQDLLIQNKTVLENLQNFLCTEISGIIE